MDNINTGRQWILTNSAAMGMLGIVKDVYADREKEYACREKEREKRVIELEYLEGIQDAFNECEMPDTAQISCMIDQLNQKMELRVDVTKIWFHKHSKLMYCRNTLME